MSRIRQNSNYIYGNTARDIDVVAALREAPTGAPLRELKNEKKRQSRMHMSVLYVLFLAGAIFLTGSSIFSFLKMQAEIATSSDRIAAYEQQYYRMKLENDDEYSKINKSVDLDEIRRIAIEELGMVYADENQIISYTRENSDYVRQVKDVTE